MLRERTRAALAVAILLISFGALAVDTQRSVSACATLLADNAAGDISAQDLRDCLVASVLFLDGTSTTGLVVNEAGADLDVRMEGDTDPNLLTLDASTDRIGIGVAVPTTKLDVGSGTITAAQVDNGGSAVTIPSIDNDGSNVVFTDQVTLPSSTCSDPALTGPTANSGIGMAGSDVYLCRGGITNMTIANGTVTSVDIRASTTTSGLGRNDTTANSWGFISLYPLTTRTSANCDAAAEVGTTYWHADSGTGVTAVCDCHQLTSTPTYGFLKSSGNGTCP